VQPVHTTVLTEYNSNQPGTIHHHPNREQILNNLLRVELGQVIRDYLSRTRRSFPIHYIYDMSDIASQQP